MSATINLGRVVGYSAYEVAVQNGFVGTEEEWLASLKGEDGEQGAAAVNPFKGWFTSDTQLISEYPNPSDGDYAYVQGTTDVIVYQANSGQWRGTSKTFNPAYEQTFASGEEVNSIKISKDINPLGNNELVSGDGLFEVISDEKDITKESYIKSHWNNVALSGGKYIQNVSKQRFCLLLPNIENVKSIRFKTPYIVALHQIAGVGDIDMLDYNTQVDLINNSGYLSENTDYKIEIEQGTERLVFQCQITEDSLSNTKLFDYIIIETVLTQHEQNEILSKKTELLCEGTETDILPYITSDNGASTALSGGSFVNSTNRYSVMLPNIYANTNSKIKISFSNIQLAIQQFKDVNDVNAILPYIGFNGVLTGNSEYLDPGEYVFDILPETEKIVLQTKATSFNSLMSNIVYLKMNVADKDVTKSAIVGLMRTTPIYNPQGFVKNSVNSYEGEKPIFQLKKGLFYLEDYFVTNNSTYGVQGGAIFRDYLFQFSHRGYVEIYNFKEKTFIAEISIPNHDTTYDHCDTVSFGTQRVNESDYFPVVYASGTQVNSVSITPYIKVFRIQKSDNSWSISLVQKINLPTIDNIGSYPDAVIDNVNNCMWVMGWDTSINSDSIDRQTCYFTKFSIPHINMGNVTIDYADRIDKIAIDDLHNTQQGILYYGGKIYIPYGAKTRGYQGIDIVDLQLQKTVTKIDLYNTPIGEPECVVLYEGELYVVPNKYENIRKLVFC